MQKAQERREERNLEKASIDTSFKVFSYKVEQESGGRAGGGRRGQEGARKLFSLRWEEYSEPCLVEGLPIFSSHQLF